jgi:dihydroorotase
VTLPLIRHCAAGALLCLAQAGFAQVTATARYDLLLRGGHVIDAKNNISAVRDVAIAGGKIVAVAERLNPADAVKTVDVTGLYVTPGLVDMHVHAYTGTGERNSYAGDNAIYPDGFSFRSGITTMVDAGGAGWRNFEDFKDRVIDRAQTRVLAFLNIVGAGMRGARYENNLEDMSPGPAAEMAQKYKGLIVGIKCAHYSGPDWGPIERSVEAGTKANIPVMVDFGDNRPATRPSSELWTKKLRPGDIYTHSYSGVRDEQDASGHVNPAMFAGRKRGVLFDVGHGGGSFAWRIAVPAIKEGFLPDTISTDLHVGSMNSGMKDLPNVMSKFLALGLPLDDVVRLTTWAPARVIGHEELGNLSVGAPADVTVLSLQNGRFGFTDSYGAKLESNRKLVAELTIRNGKVVYDLNGITRPNWDTLPKGYTETGDSRWDGVTPARMIRPMAPRPAAK